MTPEIHSDSLSFFPEPCKNPTKFISDSTFSPAGGFEYKDPSGDIHNSNQARPSSGDQGIKLEIEDGSESSVTYKVQQPDYPDHPVQVFKVRKLQPFHEQCL
jgi:hypothetical protein